MALCVGVMKCKKCKCRRRTWLLTTGTPGAKATQIAGSAGEIRLCMDTSPAWWQSARSLDDKVRLALEASASTCVCVSCAYDLRVLYICCSAPSCIQLHCHGVCALVLQKIESDSRDSYAPRSHMHTGASAHATQAGRRLPRRD
jgi:hypothetical protein